MKKNALFFCVFIIFFGCSQKDSTQDNAGEVEQETELNPQIDVGFAISYANNWLLKPNLEEVEKVKKLLEEAASVRPKEVENVLGQVDAEEQVLRNEKLIADAEALIKESKFLNAREKVEQYLKIKQSEKAKHIHHLLTVMTDPKIAARYMEVVSRDVLELLDKNPKYWGEYKVKIIQNLDEVAVENYPELVDHFLNLCQERISVTTQLVIEQDRKEKHSNRLTNFETVLNAIPLNAGVLEAPKPAVLYRLDDMIIKVKNVSKMWLEGNDPDLRIRAKQSLVRAKTEVRKIVQHIFGSADFSNVILEFPLAVNSGASGYFGIPLEISNDVLKNLPRSESRSDNESLESYVKNLEAEDDLYAICQVKQDRKKFQILTIYKKLPYGVKSAITGVLASSPSELFDVEFDYTKREALYKPLASQYSCQDESLLHIRLPDIEGWLVDEGKLKLQARIDSGTVKVARMHVSSKKEVLIDLICQPAASGTLSLGWMGLTEEVKVGGNATSAIKKISLQEVTLLGSDGIGKAVQWGQSKKVSPRMVVFNAKKADTYLAIHVSFPKKIHSFPDYKTFGSILEHTTKIEVSLDKEKWVTVFEKLDNAWSSQNENTETIFQESEKADFYIRIKVPKGKSFNGKTSFSVWSED